MRKFILAVFILLPFIASCSFPNPNQAATPDLIGTQVAINLTSSPTVPGPTKPQPTSPQATSLLPTIAPTTNAKTATQTPALTATDVVLTTSTATVTPTVQPSPTTVSSDPALALGNPTWKDTFTNGKSWGLDTPYDDGNTRVEITNNTMILTSANAKGWHGWRVSYLKPKNFYLEATIQTQTCSENDLYGILFRSSDGASGYWFGVTCDGHYNLRAGDGGTFTELIKSTAGSAILAGSNQTNRLGIMVKDDKISLYANGKPLADASDSTYPNAGTFGYFIAGKNTINFSVVSTKIAYWNLP